MSIASEITRLQNAKAALKSSIEAKGVTVPSSTKLDEYPALVNSIPTGGGGGGTEVELTRPIFYLAHNIIDRDVFTSCPISSYGQSSGYDPTAIPSPGDPFEVNLSNVTVGLTYRVKFEAVTNINILGTNEFTGTISDSDEITDEDGVSYLPKRYEIGTLHWEYTDAEPKVPNIAGYMRMTVEIGTSIMMYGIYCVNTEQL